MYCNARDSKHQEDWTKSSARHSVPNQQRSAPCNPSPWRNPRFSLGADGVEHDDVNIPVVLCSFADGAAAFGAAIVAAGSAPATAADDDTHTPGGGRRRRSRLASLRFR